MTPARVDQSLAISDGGVIARICPAAWVSSPPIADGSSCEPRSAFCTWSRNAWAWVQNSLELASPPLVVSEALELVVSDALDEEAESLLPPPHAVSSTKAATPA